MSSKQEYTEPTLDKQERLSEVAQGAVVVVSGQPATRTT